jgi:hypothetical protein
MPLIPVKALNTPLAREFAEALLVQHDMRLSLEAMKLWGEKYAGADPEKDKEGSIICGSLFRDAVIQFVGCFDESAKFHLSAEAIYGHDPNGLSSFQWFKDTRDAYAAHKFGAQRQCVVGAVLEPSGKRSLTKHLSVYRGQTKEDAPILLGFMRTASKHLDQLVNALAEKVADAVRKMTPEEYARLEDGALYGLEQHEARLSRQALQRARSGQPHKGRNS